MNMNEVILYVYFILIVLKYIGRLEVLSYSYFFCFLKGIFKNESVKYFVFLKIKYDFLKIYLMF